MSQHSFDTDIAKQYGVESAIILQHIAFWIEKNKANEKHFNDGCYWTYNSVRAFSELFPYMTECSIRCALKKLKDADMIKVGNFNNSAYDRTIWYSLTEKASAVLKVCICQKQQINLSKNENQFAKINEPIPYINTYRNTDKSNMYVSKNKTYPGEEYSADFNTFWTKYPRHVSKQSAYKAWIKNKPNSAFLADVLKALEWQVCQDSWKKDNGQFIPHPATYLNQKRWLDEKPSNVKVAFKFPGRSIG